jgi:undecaprenyl phosphate-alpha-L-ara4FN deformylase
VECSAAAGWRADDRVATVKEAFGFRYNSDCRGGSIFRPRLTDGGVGAPQVPVSLPTYDEMVGPAMSPCAFTDHILARMRPGVLETYTIHAEVEGIAMAGEFARLLKGARRQGVTLRPLRDLLPADVATLPVGSLGRGEVPGRQGWLGVQL